MKRYSSNVFPNESNVFKQSIGINYSNYIASLGRLFEMYSKSFRLMFPHKSPLNAPHPSHSWNCMQNQLLPSILSPMGNFQVSSMPIPELASGPLTSLVTHKGSINYAKEGSNNMEYSKPIATSEHKRDEVTMEQVDKQKKETIILISEKQNTANGLISIQAASERTKESINDMIDNIFKNTRKMLKKAKTEGKSVRKRKTRSQIAILKKELLGSEAVSKEKIIELANETGLSKDQVYKWLWDQRQKKN